jgi:cyclopropane fatty-acyl-phospholipid synthase-like methyltransferase
VLDVGCGSGATTLAAAATAERAVGVDLSQPLVELARRRARAAKIANTEFVIAEHRLTTSPPARSMFSSASLA